MRRIIDLFLALFLFVLFFIVFIILAILVKITSDGPVIYWSHRSGKDNIIFKMPKFRTMIVDAPVIETEKLNNASNLLTPIGGFLRSTSLDEIPQIFSVLKGDMSFIGPRPALYNQYYLIDLRTNKGLDKLLPGITGWAQVNGRDSLSTLEKVLLDEEYLHKRSFLMDFKVLFLTILKVIRRDGVSH
jgi:O-antigen biosynthesis protein WbqP